VVNDILLFVCNTYLTLFRLLEHIFEYERMAEAMILERVESDRLDKQLRKADLT
jgi:hypothetical protein